MGDAEWWDSVDAEWIDTPDAEFIPDEDDAGGATAVLLKKGLLLGVY